MDMGKCKRSAMDYVKCIFLSLVLLVGLFFLIGEKVLPVDIPDNDYQCEEYRGDWVRVNEDGSRVPVLVPGKCEALRGETVTVETTLDFTPVAGSCLCFRSSKQEMWIYVDGELRESYSTKESRLFGRTGAVVFVFLDLLPEDEGKTLTLVTESDSPYSGLQYTVYYGNRMGVWHQFARQYGLELVVAFFTLLLGALSIIGSIFLHIAYRRRINLEYLGWGVVLAGIWLVTNSVFRQLLFPNMAVVNAITFCMIMLMPIPFLIYMDGIQKERYRIPYMVMISVDFMMFVVCTVLHFTGVVDFADTIRYIAVTSMLSILLMGVTMVMDTCKRKVKEYRIAALGVLGAALAACVQIVVFFLSAVQFSGVILALGLIFLLLISVIGTIQEIIHIEKEKQQAILSSEAKAKFLANMSHEIRTPINAVLGMDAMILRENQDPKIKEYAVDIRNAGQTLLGLINDILDMSKIESGKMKIVPAEYDFSSMLHDIANMISMKANDKNLEFNVLVNQQLPSRMYGDEIRIRQVLINILNNAVKYTEQGSVTFKVDGKVEEDDAILLFSVKDTGIGIKEEDLSKLFVEFERLDEDRNRNIEGTGLGMNITAQLLEMMGSHIQVNSVYGQGSEFFFELRQKIMNPEPIGNLEERIRQQTQEYIYNASFTAPDAHLLVVDDNAVNLKVFCGLLKDTKVQIDQVESGMECLERVRKNHYDIIFLDHMMPEMDGIETLHAMKEMQDYPCKATPVVALTANAVAGAKEMYLSEGFDEFLAKPIIPDKLENLIRRMLPRELLVFDMGEPVQMPSVEHEEAQQAVSVDANDTEDVELPEVEGIEWDYGEMHLHDKSLLLDTARDFYRMLDTEADYLEDCYHQIFSGTEEAESREQVLNLYRIKVHAMKGSSALIGAMQLFGLAKTLEYAARDEKISVIEHLTPVFLQEWRSYKEKLEVCMPPEDERIAVEDFSVILEYLDILKPAMEEQDIDEADRIMEALMQYEYGDEIEKVMEQLQTAVTDIDSDRAIELIDKLETMIKI